MDRHNLNDAVHENYVIDIATMRIADDGNNIAMPALKICENNNKCGGMAVNCDIQLLAASVVQRVEDDSESRVVGECGDYELKRTYLKGLEIDRNEEVQTITELVQNSGHGPPVGTARSKGMRVAFAIMFRLMLPLANGVMRGFKGMRDVRFLHVLKSITSSRSALTNLVAFAANTVSLNLSAVQVSHRIGPILKLLKVRKSSDGVESLPDTCLPASAPSTPSPTPPSSPAILSPISFFLREPLEMLPPFSTGKRKMSAPQPTAPKCCTLNVLAEPPPGEPIRADIVFIHGLHGSLANTWRQGLWENDRQPVGFERPPKPPVRPPKRPRHSRAALSHPPHKQKRAKFAYADPQQRPTQASHVAVKELDDGFFDATEQEMENGFSYVCGEPHDIQHCDSIEYSLPTFRLRTNDNGRQLQAELESIINGPNSGIANAHGESHETNTSSRWKSTPKPSPNDPNYSKCWPGEWLPMDCPGVRVIAVNYTTDQYLWRPMWKNKEPRTNLVERSREMAELLIKHRIGYGHPIVWVGHSKGGLFIKQIIVDAWESGRPAMAPFWRSARGVFFYSVPHRGSHLASIKAPLLTRSVELLDIEKNSKYLLDLHRRFAGLYHLGHLKVEVFSFVETALTLMSVLYMRIVGVDSADPGFGDVCGIRLDHREICKPRSRDCILYKELVKMINKVC